MSEAIEQMIMKILNQVSDIEKARNKALVSKTARVLKALEYMKATAKLKQNGKLGA